MFILCALLDDSIILQVSSDDLYIDGREIPHHFDFSNKLQLDNKYTVDI